MIIKIKLLIIYIQHKLTYHFAFLPVNVFLFSFFGVTAKTFLILVAVVFTVTVPLPGVIFLGVLVPFLVGV